MVRARGKEKVLNYLDLTGKEYETLKRLVEGKSQKEISGDDRVTEACVSKRIKTAQERNGFKSKQLFLLKFTELISLLHIQ